ncbi:MAG: hypothetical protein SPH83_05910 [Treponema sp.]|nr:hypothetical protein [Spirochaetales bacterium]MDY6190013.1 hypothetical protein [Treponema sp.]
MKKVLGLAISFCMLFGTVFAKGVYDGDIQLHLGLGLDSAKAVAEVPYLEDSVKYTMESGSTTVDFELSTWHLFDVNDLIGVGFNLGFSGGIGKTSKMTVSSVPMPSDQLSIAGHFNGLIGPAVGFTLNDVIKFDLAVGFAYGLDLYSYEYENYDRYSRSSGVDTFMIFGAGFGFDVQAKFFPKSVVSPVLGYRLSSIFSSEVISSDLDFLSAYWDSVNYIANEIYLGVSFNW